MKKSLLLLSMAAMVAGVSAQQPKEPQFLGGLAIQNVSPNGKWAASEANGVVVLINTETGATTEFIGDGYTEYFNLGLGSALSNDGVLCAAQNMDGNGSYYDGEWKYLPTPEGSKSADAHSITPDGSRICGNLGLQEMTYDDVTMIVPAVWERQADGTYGECVVLPHPSLDLFGRAPQYITAICISDDGRTVVGQIQDCRGMYLYPIVYKQAADGEWSYSLPTEALFNPNHVEVPVWPGESPDRPAATSYMTEEKKAEYEAAVQAWRAAGDYSQPYPQDTDYLTEEQLAEYNAAMAEYQAVMEVWEEQSSNYYIAYQEIVDVSPNFQFNQVGLSADGSKFGMTVVTTVEDPMAWMGWSEVNHVWIINADGEEIVKYEDKELSVKAWVGDYLTAVEVDEMTNAFNGYLLKDGVTTSLYDFLCAKGDDIKEWVDLNMTHEVEVYDYENDQLVYESVMATGLPIASRDWDVVASWTHVSWESEYYVESYLFDFRNQGGIGSVAMDKKEQVRFDADGNLSVGDGVVSVAVYDLSGVCVKSVSNPNSSVALDAANGVYIVKAVYADGSESVVKAVK